MFDSPNPKEQVDEELKVLRQRDVDLQNAADEQKQTEPLLRRADDRYRKIFNYSNDAIFLVDPVEDAILDVNAKACNSARISL